MLTLGHLTSHDSTSRCVVSWLLRVSDVMTSQDTGGVRLRDGRTAASVCRREADPVSVVAYGVVWTHCTRGGCYWTRVGCTSGRWGLRAVRTTLGQWIPTLVEQADSRRLGAGRRRTMTTGTLRRWWAGVGGGGPVTEAPGSAARPTDSRSCAARRPTRPLPFGPALTSKTTSLPKVPARASVSEVMTPTCLPREETAHETHRP